MQIRSFKFWLYFSSKTKITHKNKQLTAKTVNLQGLHQPVLLKEVRQHLAPKPPETYLDLTAGGGGHAQVLATILGEESLTLIDADPSAIADLKQRFKQATCHHGNYARHLANFQRQGITFDLIFADLGLSSIQLQAAERGFSFNLDGRLDMRFDPSVGQPLLQRLEQTDKQTLTRILFDYGQEREASAIAAAILEQKPQTTLDLASLVSKLKRKPRRRIHPATQTFMALRIWVNDELSNLKVLLEIAPFLLKDKGRLAIISFHSLEDRLIKHAFRDLADGDYDSSYFLKNKKPIVPDKETLVSFPQARSAKLRILGRD